MRFSVGIQVLAAICCSLPLTIVWSAPPERPTLNHTADPRPNILPDWIYNHHVSYRAIYNRPTYYGGKIATMISPTSQEALAWQENVARGYYDGHHCPPTVKRFMYPKPWEALNTGPRVDTTKQSVIQQVKPQPLEPQPLEPQNIGAQNTGN